MDGSALHTLAAVPRRVMLRPVSCIGGKRWRVGRRGCLCPIITAEVVFLDVALDGRSRRAQAIDLAPFCGDPRARWWMGLHPGLDALSFVDARLCGARLLGEEPRRADRNAAMARSQPSGVWGCRNGARFGWFAGAYDRRGLYPAA